MEREYALEAANIRAMLTSINRRVTNKQLKSVAKMTRKVNRKIEAFAAKMSLDLPLVSTLEGSQVDTFRSQLKAVKERVESVYGPKCKAKRAKVTRLCRKLELDTSATTYREVILQFANTPGRERLMVYNAYMSSNAWAKVKRRVLAARRAICSTCGSTANIHVHHKTYERLGAELDEDLEILCKPCHMQLHRRKAS